MVDTTATLDLKGSGNLKDYLSDLYESMKELNKVTKTQEKEFSKLNKVGDETGSFTKGLAESVEKLYEAANKITKTSKDSFSFLKNTGESTIKLNEGLTDASKGLSGFGLRIVGARKEVVALNSVIDKPAGHFRDIAEAQGATAKAFVILNKASQPIIKGLNFLSDQLDKVGEGFRNAEVLVANFARTSVNVGAKSIQFISDSFSNLSENLKNSGIVGRLFANSFVGVAKTLEQGADSAAKFAKSIDPSDLSFIDKAGEQVADVVDKVGKGVDRLAVGVRLADVTGDIYRMATGTRDAATAFGRDLADGVKAASGPLKTVAQMASAVATKMQLASTGAKLLGFITGNQLVSALGGLVGTLSLIGIQASSFLQLGAAASDAYLQAQGLNDTFDTMQRMGIDTSAAQIAFQFGLVGEKLLFSAEAAKEFGKTAITAFAGLEDAAAFVTTLGAGASLQFGEYEAGVESISAAMTNLVSGPLNNTISSVEATNALYNSLSAGVGVARDGTVNLAESQEFLTASLKLSSSTGADAAQTLELLAKTSTVYGLSTAEAATTASKLYQVVEQGITTFPQLTSGMGRALVSARGLGVEMDQALGSITALTQVMGSDEALTGFSGLMASIAGQGEQAAKELADLGIQFNANSIKAKGLGASLDELYTATGGNSAQIKRIIPDLRAYQSAMILMTSASDRAAKATESMADAGEESLEKVFAARQQSTIQQFSQIMNGFNEVLVDFGRRALPAIQPGVDFLEMLLGILQSLPEPLKNVIGSIVLAQTAISNIGGGLVSFGLSLAQIIAALTVFRLLFKFKDIGKEWGVLKEINSDGIDFAGTILRLIGFNEKYDASSSSLNKQLKQQSALMSSLSREKLDFDTSIQSAEELDGVLANLQNKIRDQQELRDTAGRASIVAQSKGDGEGQTASLIQVGEADKELARLEKIEKKVVGYKKRLEATQVFIFKDLEKTVSQELSKTEVSLVKRKKMLDSKLDSYFGTFGDKGKQYSAQIQETLDTVIPDYSLTTREKIEVLNETFSKIAEDAPDSIRENLNKVQKEVSEGIQRLDGTYTSIPGTVGQLVNLSVEAASKGIDEASRQIIIQEPKLRGAVNQILENTKKQLPDKIEELNALFSRLTEGAPQAARAGLLNTQAAIIGTLQRAEGPIAAAVEKTSNQFNNFNNSIREALSDPSSSIETKIVQINGLFARLGQNAPESVKLHLQNLELGITSGLEKAKQAAEKESQQLSLELGEIGGPSVQSRIQSNLQELIANTEQEIGRLRNVATHNTTQLSLDLESVGGPPTQGRVAANLGQVQEVVRKGTEQTGQVVQQGVQKVNNQLNQIGGSSNKGIDKLKGSFGSIMNLASNLHPAFGQVASVGRDVGQVFEELGVKGTILTGIKTGMAKASVAQTVAETSHGTVQKASLGLMGLGAVAGAKLAKVRAGLTLTNIKLAISEKALAKSTAISSKAQLAGAKVGSVLAKAKGILASTISTLSKGLALLGKSLITLAKFLAPFLGWLALAAAALFLVHKAVQALVPAYKNATDANTKFANQLAESSKEVEASREKIEKLTKSVDELALKSATAMDSFEGIEREALATMNERDIQGLTGASKEEIKQLRQEILEQTTPDEAAFVQSWGKPLVGTLEFLRNFVKGASDLISRLPLQITAAVTGALGTLTERIPVVGNMFKRVSENVKQTLFGITKAQKEADQESRKYFNKLRDGIQQFIAGPAREAARAAGEDIENLVFSTDKLVSAYEKGGVAFLESKEVMKKASEENRALNATELAEVLTKEREVNELARDEIQKTIELKQAELEKAKDPVVREELERQIKMLQDRNIKLENGLKLQEAYTQNVNALLNLRDLNDAAQGEEQLLARINQIYDGLSENAKKRFIELGDLTQDVEGNITDAAGNLANSSQRRAMIAFQGARAGFLETIESLNDPEAGIDPDKFATDLFNTLEAVDTKVAEGVIDFEAGEAIKQQYRNIVVELTDADGNIQSGLAESFLRTDQLKSLEESSIDAIRTTTDRAIEIKSEEAKVISAQQAQNLITAKEFAQEQLQLNEEVGKMKLAAEEKILQARIAQEGEGSRAVIDQERVVQGLKLELAVEGFNDRKAVLDAELAELQKKQENEIKFLENTAEKSNATATLRTKTLNMDQEAMQASQDLAQSIANFEVNALQNKLKFTGDIEEKARIELQLAEGRQEVLKQEQEFELRNLDIQEELNELGLEREKTELRIAAAQLQAQKAQIELQISQAERLNTTQVELDAMELQLESLNTQIDLNDKQSEQLVEQETLQEDINAKRRESIGLQQEAARQTSAAEIELARIEEVNAQFEKQKEILKLNAQEVETAGEERLQNLQEQETLLNGQNSIIQKQVDIIKETEAISQRLFNMAKEGAFSAFRQRRLEREAAQEKLKNLESIQKIEKFNLEIQQQQRELALVRKEIELDVAQAKQEASLAESQAELARVNADPRTTAEQRRAAELTVRSQEVGLAGVGSQRDALGMERMLNELTNRSERNTQRQEFGVQRLEAESALANTQRGRSGRRRVGRQALEMARESSSELESLIDNFNIGSGANSMQGFSPTASAFAAIAPAMSGGSSSDMARAAQGLTTSNQQLNQGQGQGQGQFPTSLSGRVEVILDVKGEAAKLDKDALQQAASDGLYRGLDQLFTYAIQRQR